MRTWLYFSLGFHVPPFITVPHLHLHVLAPFSQIFRWSMEKYTSFWYLTVSKLIYFWQFLWSLLVAYEFSLFLCVMSYRRRSCFTNWQRKKSWMIGKLYVINASSHVKLCELYDRRNLKSQATLVKINGHCLFHYLVSASKACHFFYLCFF